LSTSPDVGVVARGRHLCLEARGIRTRALATTLLVTGQFQEAGLQRTFLDLTLDAPGNTKSGYQRRLGY
jgi:GTP cyclohydrolase I